LRAAPADAQPADSITWQGPPGCADAAPLRAALAERLGRPLDAGTRVAVAVTAEAGGLRAVPDLEAGAAPVHRELVAADCAEVVAAVAVVVSLAAAAAPPPPAPPPEPPPPPAEPAPAMTGRRRPARPFAAARAWQLGGRLQVSAMAGALPEASIGAEAAAWLAWRAAEAELAGAWWPTRRAERFADGAEVPAAVDVGLTTASARLCGRALAGGVRGCALGQLGRLRARGADVTEAREEHVRWTALGVSAAARVRVHRHLALTTSADLVRALDRPRFVLADGTTLFRPSGWAGQLGLGLELVW
jgi:hypothetical protein